MFDHTYATPELFRLTQMPSPSEFLDLAAAGEAFLRICHASQEKTPGMLATRAAYDEFIVKCKVGVQGMDPDQRLEYHDEIHMLCMRYLQSTLSGFAMHDLANQFELNARVLDRVLGAILAARKVGALSDSERRALVNMTLSAVRTSKRPTVPEHRRATWVASLAETIEEYELSFPQDAEYPDHYNWLAAFRRRQTISVVH